MSLERFHLAQDAGNNGYSTAFAEMCSGKKRSHWIWYIFPQIEGLGRSFTAQKYALRDLDEACAYLEDPVLRRRYEEIAAVVYDRLEEAIPVEVLMGGSVDASKLASSLTLFHAAASRLDMQEKDRALVHLCDSILQVTALQGYPPCELTLKKLEGS